MNCAVVKLFVVASYCCLYCAACPTLTFASVFLLSLSCAFIAIAALLLGHCSSYSSFSFFFFLHGRVARTRINTSSHVFPYLSVALNSPWLHALFSSWTYRQCVCCMTATASFATWRIFILSLAPERDVSILRAFWLWQFSVELSSSLRVRDNVLCIGLVFVTFLRFCILYTLHTFAHFLQCCLLCHSHSSSSWFLKIVNSAYQEICCEIRYFN